MRRHHLLLAFLFLCHAALAQRLIDYVDTRVGTAQNSTHSAGLFGKGSEEMGQTLPAVLVPNGMNFWTPQTQDTEVKCRAPYYYRDDKIQGFRASHWIVGGCTQDYGSVTVAPLCPTDIPSDAERADVKRSRCFLPEDRASSFTHESETATPSYYAVTLEDYQIRAEMTGLSHSAIFRFSYPSDSTACLVVNPNSDEGEGYIEVLPERHLIRGYNPAHRIYQGKGQPCGFSGYFIVQLPDDVTIDTYGTYHADTIFSGKKIEKDKVLIGAYVTLRSEVRTKDGRLEIPVKIATSFVGWDGCEKNLVAEIPHWNFEQTREEATAIWERHLNRINITLSQVDKGSSESASSLLNTFYTALYHASFLPREFSDVDGRYPSFAGGKEIMQMPKGRKYYEDYSMWDTYRAVHPLLNLMQPAKAGDMMQSLVLKYEQGGWQPIFPCWNSYTAAMIGDHCTAALADAYVKGIKGFDVATAYEAMRKNAFESPATYEEYANGMGRRALSSYLQYGYIPLEDSVKEAYHKCEQVSRTLEYAYDDFCLAQVAQKLQEAKTSKTSEKREFEIPRLRADYNTLLKRSRNYRHVIDKRSGYAQGRYADGTFLDADNQTSFCKFITEGAPCHYTWYVPHDVKGLMKAMGGRKAFVTRLDSLFEQRRYWHGNEPCHQVAYLYNYVDQPHKTQAWVNHILRTEYSFSPGGLSGNDDAGQMSAWYVFSAMGLYPVCPGTTQYAITSPLFPTITLHLENGRTFTIKAKHLSEQNIYIHSIKLNGKRLKRAFLSHQDVVNGGVLELGMTDKP